MKINSMNSLMKFMLGNHKNCHFRGQCDSTWHLESTINRSVKTNPVLTGRELTAEKALIDAYNKSAHLYDRGYESFKGKKFATLTYIQHHGAPTRLLDLTSSKYIALFFAFDNVDMSSKNNYVRIWYFNTSELLKKTAALTAITDTKTIYSDFENIWETQIEQNNKEAIYLLVPEINSQRSHIQKGAFICSGIINKTVHEIYERHYKDVISFIDIHKNLYKEVYFMLNSMNISHKTLYGGIEGFSKDLQNNLNLLS